MRTVRRMSCDPVALRTLGLVTPALWLRSRRTTPFCHFFCCLLCSCIYYIHNIVSVSQPQGANLALVGIFTIFAGRRPTLSDLLDG